MEERLRSLLEAGDISHRISGDVVAEADIEDYIDLDLEDLEEVQEAKIVALSNFIPEEGDLDRLRDRLIYGDTGRGGFGQTVFFERCSL